jgi:hypothetical protein
MLHTITIGPIEAAMRARHRESYSRLNPKPKVTARIKINDLTPNAATLPFNVGAPIPDYQLTYGALGTARRLMIADLIRATCEHFKVSQDDFKSARRPRYLFVPRQIAAYLARTMTDHSLPDIARRFGGRDHTTIMHSVNKIARLLSEGDEATTAHVEAVRSAAESLCGAYQNNRSASCSYHQTTAQ